MNDPGSPADGSGRQLTSTAGANGSISCVLANSGGDIQAGYRLCMSLLIPCEPAAGCAIVKSLGGYAELRPDPEAALAAGASWRFEIQTPRYPPLNRSWGPAGVYLVDADGQAVPVRSETMSFPHRAAPASRPAGETQPARTPVFPSPRTWAGADGACDLEAGLALADDAPAAARQALAAVDGLAERMRLAPLGAAAGRAADCRPLEDEAGGLPRHRVSLHPEQIEIAAGCEDGFRHAFTSLLLLRELHGDEVPCGSWEDSPRFSWRGLHLDCARHYYGVPSLLRLLDLMALLKLNRFHWHFIDDEAFRLELECFPELAERTARRGHGQLVPGLFGGGAGPNGGSYSREDVATVLERASLLGIEVMPEIEIPAHAWSLLQVLPQMRDPDDASGQVSVQGYPDNVINPAMPATWDFLRKALPEIAALFPLGIVHLGCDEMPPQSWTRSPLLEKWKSEHGLADALDVQEKMMRDAAAILAESGARPAVWEEGAQGRNGGMGSQTLLFSWRGQEPGLQAAAAGYDVVMCPAQHVYFDMAPSDDPAQRGINWAAIVSLAETVSWEPVPADRPELDGRIVGVQGALWSETVLEDRDMEPMLVPRILGLAEVAWAAPENKASVPQLRGVARRWRKLAAKTGWNASELD